MKEEEKREPYYKKIRTLEDWTKALQERLGPLGFTVAPATELPGSSDTLNVTFFQRPRPAEKKEEQTMTEFRREADIHAQARDDLTTWRKPTPVSITVGNSAGGVGGTIEMQFDAEWVEISSVAPCVITQERRGIVFDFNAGQREASEALESEGTSKTHYSVIKNPQDLADYLNKELREAGCPARVVVPMGPREGEGGMEATFFSRSREKAQGDEKASGAEPGEGENGG